MVYNFYALVCITREKACVSFRYKEVPDICLSRYTDSRCRDKIVVRPSYLYQGNSSTGKTMFLKGNSYLISRYIAIIHERKKSRSEFRSNIIFDNFYTLTFWHSVPNKYILSHRVHLRYKWWPPELLGLSFYFLCWCSAKLQNSKIWRTWLL